jgi:hypothetical protein
MRPFLSCCLLAGFIAGSAASLGAAEICVACEGPAATYRCSVEGLPEGKNQALANEVQVHACEKVLAKLERHSGCRANLAAATCAGKSRVVTLTDYQRAIAGDVETTYEPGAIERAKRGMQSAWTCVTSFFSDC